MSTPAVTSSHRRAAAAGVAVAGPLIVITISLHPTILEGDVAGVVIRTGPWVLIHWLTAAAVMLSWWAVHVTVASHRDELGTLGRATQIVVTVGAVVLTAEMLIEALLFPVLARHAPELLELDGPTFRSVGLMAVGGLGAAHLVGLGGLGVVLGRAKIWGRFGWTLTAAMVAFAALAGMFVPVAGVLSSVVLAGAFAWWGWLLWGHVGEEIA